MSGRADVLYDGDATFVKTFTKVAFGDSGQQYSFGFKAEKGKKFVVLLLGEMDAKANDCDLDALLNRLGYFKREQTNDH